MYFKILELFILKTLFNKGEYNITSKEFNPIKFFIILLLVANVFFTVYLLYKLSYLYELLAKECPAVISTASKRSEALKHFDDHIKSEIETQKKLKEHIAKETDKQQKAEYNKMLEKLEEHLAEEIEQRNRLVHAP